MANEIKVNPAELRKYAEQIAKCYSQYVSHLSQSRSQIESLKGVWIGQAADAFGASFQKLLTNCDEGLDTLKKMMMALYESADAYERSEKAIQNEASKLPKLPTNTMR
ncbi:MAG: WXG100 family type VII secretion target [Deltaproteobacteria bacterium]|jgi:WXG100 family type VII secretion target|nr:WXG100 family type VII secretion target [Deltaproteobacteria bacterium]